MESKLLIAEVRGILDEAAAPGKGGYSFLAVVLDEPSREDLLRWWREKVPEKPLPISYAHHMTLVFQPTKEEIEAADLGKKTVLKVVGWGSDAISQAVRVHTSLRTIAAIPHITLATSVARETKHSNDLLAKHTTDIAGPMLMGKIELVKVAAGQTYV